MKDYSISFFFFVPTGEIRLEHEEEKKKEGKTMKKG